MQTICKSLTFAAFLSGCFMAAVLITDVRAEVCVDHPVSGERVCG